MNIWLIVSAALTVFILLLFVYLMSWAKRNKKVISQKDAEIAEQKMFVDSAKKRQAEHEQILATKIKSLREQHEKVDKKISDLNKMKSDARQVIKDKIEEANEQAKLTIYKAKQKSGELYDDKIAEIEKKIADKEKIKQQAYNEGRNEAAQLLKESEKKHDEAIAKAKNTAQLIVLEARREVEKINNSKEDAYRLLQSIKSELGLLNEEYDYTVPTTSDIDYDMESEHVRAMLKQKRDEQKDVKRDNKAFSGKAGRLMLRAFECESGAHLNKVTPRNLSKSREKIINAFSLINKLGEEFQSSLNDEVLHLKIDELSIYHSYSVIKEKEREEQRAIREQMREEERARREHEKALREAEKQEKAIRKALAKAEMEMEKATAEKQSEYEAKLQELKEKLAETEGMHKRAESMAQLTKRGHVYIISNIGSFGEHMFKIGMTRRLEPMDRVKELGDASVPFPFDVHGMIFSDDAPALEAELHKIFSDRRANKVNLRKEFFNTTIEEIQGEVVRLGHKVELTLVAEAHEFMETLNINKLKNKEAVVS